MLCAIIIVWRGNCNWCEESVYNCTRYMHVRRQQWQQREFAVVPGTQTRMSHMPMVSGSSCVIAMWKKNVLQQRGLSAILHPKRQDEPPCSKHSSVFCHWRLWQCVSKKQHFSSHSLWMFGHGEGNMESTCGSSANAVRCLLMNSSARCKYVQLHIRVLTAALQSVQKTRRLDSACWCICCTHTARFAFCTLNIAERDPIAQVFS